jgi:DNA-binding LacI/PurR family transcriptional regulator
MPASVTRARSTTIRDVAERAGVSTATVSRALQGTAGVTPATRARVEAAAQALRYRPSGVARSLKLRATSTIGLIVTDIENPYFPQVIRAVEDSARERGYSVVLADGRRDQAREIQSLENLATREVDGLLIASSALTERHRSWIEESPCPVVIINGESSLPAVPAVLSDNRAGGQLAAGHVSGLGHRSICYVAAPRSSNVAVEERLGGVRSALLERGVAGASVRVVEGDGTVEGGERAAREALGRYPETTALICYNDLSAVGALHGLAAVGLRVPHDVSVVGFDDIEIAPYVLPPLTTIRQATDEMGRWAVMTLLDAIELAGREASPGSQPATPDVERIPVRLIVRASTGPPAPPQRP